MGAKPNIASWFGVAAIMLLFMACAYQANGQPTVTVDKVTSSGDLTTIQVDGYWHGSGSAVFYSWKIDNWSWSTWATATQGGTSTTRTNIPNGNHVWWVKCKDANGVLGNTAQLSFTVLIPDPPVMTAIPDYTIVEGQTLTFVVTASDPNHLPLTYTDHNRPLGASFNATTRTFSWTPSIGQRGVYSGVSFTCDNGTYQDTKSTTITVNPAPPVVSNLVPTIDGPSVSLSWQVSDPTAVSYYALDPSPSPTYIPAPGTSVTFTNLMNGQHNFCVYAQSAQGLIGGTTCVQFTINVNYKPVLIVNDGSFKSLLKLDRISYGECTIADISSGAVNLNDYSSVVLTNNSFKQNSNPQLTKKFLLIYEPQGNPIYIGPLNATYYPTSQVLSLPAGLPTDGTRQVPVQSSFVIDWNQIALNAGGLVMGQDFVVGERTAGAYNSALGQQDWLDGQLIWGAIGVINGASISVFMTFAPACPLTVEVAGGACDIAVPAGAIAAVTTTALLLRDATSTTSISTVQYGNVAEVKNQQQLVHSMSGTINCNYYTQINPTTGAFEIRSDAPSICRYPWWVKADEPFYVNNQGLWNSGRFDLPTGPNSISYSGSPRYVLAPSGSQAMAKRLGQRTTAEAGREQLLIDLNSDNFTISTNGTNHRFDITRRGSGFQPELVCDSTLRADTQYVSHGFTLDSLGNFSTMDSTWCMPATPVAWVVGNHRLTVGLAVTSENGGVLQVTVGSQVSWHSLSAGQGLRDTFDFALSSAAGNTTVDYPIQAVFRPGAISGPLVGAELSDVAWASIFHVTWEYNLLTVTGGWNMISLPFIVGDGSRTNLYPTSISKAFAYSGGYVAEDTLRNGVGYWVKFASLQPVNIAGNWVSAETISVRRGWNMIGGISDPVPVNQVASLTQGLTTSPFFGYTGRYVTVDSLLPGRGYWVRVDTDGQLIMSTSDGSVGQPLGKINIVATNDLPPSPPSANLTETTVRPTTFDLGQNYPNPFNPTTVIWYQLPQEGLVTIQVVNTLGQVLAIMEEGWQLPGRYEATFEGSQLPSGIYFYRLVVDGGVVGIRKMVLMK